MITEVSHELDFTLPSALEAGEPPEARGLARDAVRLMVSYRTDNRVTHARFRDLGVFLDAGDLLVINTSGTLNAALDATGENDARYELHLSTHLPRGLWIVELRIPGADGTRPCYTATEGTVPRLGGGGVVKLLTPYRNEDTVADPDHVRLWIATLRLPCPLDAYLQQHGFPIRYGYVRQPWPIEAYQTVYATEMGSAEMPSGRARVHAGTDNAPDGAGRAVRPADPYTGVASLEDHEPPYEEYYRVPLETARRVNEARAAGQRVVAVGTTVVRALETVTDREGTTHPGEGWTRLVITPERGLRAVNALLTGLHEPRATHLHMLEALAWQAPGHADCGCHHNSLGLRSCLALASREHLRVAYAEALRENYLWHEFGDLHLILS